MWALLSSAIKNHAHSFGQELHSIFRYMQTVSWFTNQANVNALDRQPARSGDKMRLNLMVADAQISWELGHVSYDWYLLPKQELLRILGCREVHYSDHLRIQGTLDVRLGRVANHACRVERNAKLFDGVLEDTTIRLSISSFLRSDNAVYQMLYANGFHFGCLVFDLSISDDGNAVSMFTQPGQSLDTSWCCPPILSINCLVCVTELLDLIKTGVWQTKR